MEMERRNEEFRKKRSAEGAIAKIVSNRGKPRSLLPNRVKQTRTRRLPTVKCKVIISDYIICPDIAAEDIRG